MTEECWLWLGSFPDGSLRKRVPTEPGKVTRCRRSLEPSEWFCDLLQKHGGDQYPQEVLYSFNSAVSRVKQSEQQVEGFKLHALVKISSEGGCCENGPLTQWDRECNLQKSLHDAPLDAYSVSIRDVRTCVAMQHVFHKASRGVGSGGLSSIKISSPLFMPHWGAGGPQGTADEVLLESSFSFEEQVTVSDLLAELHEDTAPDDIPMLLLPFPLVILVLKREWHSILLLVRWHSCLHEHRHRRPLGPLPSWPSVDAPVWRARGQHEAPHVHDALLSAEPLNADVLQKFAGIIRSWAPALLNDPPGSSPPATVREDLLHLTRTLDSWGGSWRNAMGMLNISGGGSKFRHTARKLLDCIRLSTCLTGGPSNLADVVAQSLSLVLPEFLRAPFLSNIKSQKHGIIPSASLISRYELALDVALCLLARETADQGCIRVGWADSSPLAGYDWIWSQYHEIRESMLLSCFQAVHNLHRAVSEVVAEYEERDDDADAVLPTAPLPEWMTWLQTLKDGVREHIHPPAAMGSGRRSLADKAASEVYKWQLQTPPVVKLSEHASSYVAHCSDMGVELGLPDFRVAGSVDSLLPEWLREKHQHLPDVDNGGGPDPAQLAPHSPDVDGDFLDDGPVVELEAPVAPPPRPGQDDTVFFFPEALTVAGLQHIVSNLTADVHQGMKHWAHFFDNLKTLESLLRVDERRQRFIWTCLHGTALQGQGFRFRKFSASLYEARWHEVVNFLKCLKPLLSTLVRAWDHDKFVSGVNAEGAQRPVQAQAENAQNAMRGLSALDPERVTAILQSALFHSYLDMALRLEQVPESLASTAEGCVCHGALLAQLSEHKRHQCLEEHFGAGIKTCPMAGKLLPELVTGLLESVAEEITFLHEEELRLLPLPGLAPLSAEDWNLLISDFRQGLL